jgi:hypothetical protein
MEKELPLSVESDAEVRDSYLLTDSEITLVELMLL